LEVTKGSTRLAFQAFGVPPISGGGAVTSSKMHYNHTNLTKMSDYGPKRDEFVPSNSRYDLFRSNAFEKAQKL